MTTGDELITVAGTIVAGTSDLDFDGSLPRSFLRPALHVALMVGPSHGYEMLDYVRGFGLRSADLAGIYRALRGMEHDHMVASAWEASDAGPPRRVYELTDAGFDASERYLLALSAARAHLEDLVASVLSPVLESTPARASGRDQRARVGRTRTM